MPEQARTEDLPQRIARRPPRRFLPAIRLRHEGQNEQGRESRRGTDRRHPPRRFPVRFPAAIGRRPRAKCTHGRLCDSGLKPRLSSFGHRDHLPKPPVYAEPDDGHNAVPQFHLLIPPTAYAFVVGPREAWSPDITADLGGVGRGGGRCTLPRPRQSPAAPEWSATTPPPVERQHGKTPDCRHTRPSTCRRTRTRTAAGKSMACPRPVRNGRRETRESLSPCSIDRSV